MAITLKELCKEAEKSYNLTLIAGASGLCRAVRWVHMIEDREVPDFLHGDELIFTTGIANIQKDLGEFVQKLNEQSAAGVVINLGPYITAVPKDVIDYCERKNFPLFTLPWNVYIIDITYDFCRKIIEKEKKELTVVDAFKSMLKYPEKKAEYGAALEHFGFRAANKYTLLLINLTKDNLSIVEDLTKKENTRLWTALTTYTYHTSMFIMGGLLVVIRECISDERISNIVEVMDSFTEKIGISYRMGISECVRGYSSVPYLYKEAKMAYSVAIKNRESHVCYNDIGINKLILNVGNKLFLQKFAKGCLGALIDYDSENNTDYLNLLRYYLFCDGSVKAVAKRDNTHRNTVNTKIRLIKSVLGCEFTPEKKAELITAFQIFDMLDYM